MYLYISERGHSLIGKTAILHIVISGSSPDVSMVFIFIWKFKCKHNQKSNKFLTVWHLLLFIYCFLIYYIINKKKTRYKKNNKKKEKTGCGARSVFFEKRGGGSGKTIEVGNYKGV